MSYLSPTIQAPIITPILKIDKPVRRISIDKFLEKYRKGTNGFKLEWNDGLIEKTIAMKQSENYISQNLLILFIQLGLQSDGMLLQEVEVWTSEIQWRKPDMAYFTQSQIRLGADKTNTIPEFVIEVISTFDPINVVTTKVNEYFKAGVKVLWHIFPEQKMVYVFHSPKHISVFEAEELCRASPVLPTYAISVNDIFKKI